MIKENKQLKLEHYKNLVAIAYADGYFDDDERSYLIEKALEFGIPFEKAETVIENASDIEFTTPKTLAEKEDQLADLVCLAVIDGDVHEKEYNLCLSLTKKFGLGKKDLDLAITVAKKIMSHH